MSDSIPPRFLRLKEVKSRVPLGTDSIYRLARNGKFPKPVKLSEHASGWLESEIDAWIAERAASRAQVEPKKAA